MLSKAPQITLIRFGKFGEITVLMEKKCNFDTNSVDLIKTQNACISSKKDLQALSKYLYKFTLYIAFHLTLSKNKKKYYLFSIFDF